MAWETKPEWTMVKQAKPEAAALPRSNVYLDHLISADVVERELAHRRAEQAAAEMFARTQTAVLTYRNVRQREGCRQRLLQRQIREIEDRDVFERIAEGWKAGTAVLGSGTTVGALADFRTWDPKAKVAYAGGTVVAAGIAANALGKARGRKEVARIEMEIVESEFTVREARGWRRSPR